MKHFFMDDNFYLIEDWPLINLISCPHLRHFFLVPFSSTDMKKTLSTDLDRKSRCCGVSKKLLRSGSGCSSSNTKKKLIVLKINTNQQLLKKGSKIKTKISDNTALK